MKLVLICYAGMSTSMVLSRMKSHAETKGLDVDLVAISLSELEEHMDGAAAILLGPQIRYAVEDVRRKAENQIPVLAIDTRDYGMMRGDRILESTLKAIDEFSGEQKL